MIILDKDQLEYTNQVLMEEAYQKVFSIWATLYEGVADMPDPDQLKELAAILASLEGFAAKYLNLELKLD